LRLCDYSNNEITSKQKYRENGQNKNLYYVDINNNKTFIDPKNKWKSFFKNWYDFLNLPTDKYFDNKNKLIKYCKKHNICDKNYIEQTKNHQCLPEMPNELYDDFTNLKTELGKHEYVANKRRDIVNDDTHNTHDIDDVIIKPKKKKNVKLE
jgi:hypothetical protein